jgi:hypothetical protein
LDLTPFSAAGGENRLKPELQTELWPLVAAMCDGTIAAEDLARLESLLRSDERARLFYAAYMDLHGRLLWRFREGGRDSDAGRGLGTLVPSEVDEGSRSGSREITESQIPNQQALLVPPIIIQTSPALLSAAFSLSSPLGGWLISYAVATVITAAAILGAWVYKVSNSNSRALTVPGNAAVAVETSPGTVVSGHGGRGRREGKGWLVKWATIES